MAEIVISIGSKVAECLVGPISQGVAHLFCFRKFNEDFEKARRELEVKLEDVRNRKEEADRKNEDIMPAVEKWLDDVNAILQEAEKLQPELDRGRNNCFNVSVRYSLSKQMENKAKQMTDLKQKSDFPVFAQLRQLPGLTGFPSKDFMDFNSRKSTYNHLLEAIKDGTNKMVGLYGMAGSGKTTLAEEVGKKLNELKLFDKVIIVVISKPPNILNIQQQIAEIIGLQLQEKTQSARAQRLLEGLKNKKILIILDDVWECLRLEDIGISLVEGCHVLLTTRLRNICVSMDCEPLIELPLITKEEAWELFKKHANLRNDPSNKFDDVGRKIIDECKELPIAIVVAGRSLKEKRIEAWELTLGRLKQFQPMDVEPGLRSPYACLELSYDSLPNLTAKSLYLLCSMFPEDHKIHKEDLIRFGKRTLELEETTDTIEDVRRQILVALDILLDSCLLISTDKEACVKMHDLVRDVALWIAKKQCQPILVDSNAVSNMLVRNHQSLKDVKTLSLWDLDVDYFKRFNQLCCPTLEILLLQPHGFIDDVGAMEALKVLAFIQYGFNWKPWRVDYCSVPQSIVSLTNLHTLCLRGKILGDISLLGELKGLEILDLRGSLFVELPAGIVEMKMLKLLDIYGCQIEKSPLEVIGRCEQLEELYFWDKKSVIPKKISPSRLKRYVIYDSTCSIMSPFDHDPFEKYLDSCGETLRALCIEGFKVSDLNSSMKDLIFRANHLWLDNVRWDHRDINFQIKHLGVSCCQDQRFIIENLDMNMLQTQQVFSHLITLRLFEMNSLEQVFQDSSISYFLPMLQELWIQSCPELRTCIFSHATIMSLPKLRKLQFHRCIKVKWLLSCSLAFHCPLLEEIIIRYCSELERFIDEGVADGGPRLHDKQYYPHVSIIRKIPHESLHKK
ncbi:disease resistance protein At4g27190-like [Neltuma alba]|uniref:disease resistance protein At4g27190-like n=1 Tax=Neltuma alba TaxID=207710 RepID=UPI0010A59DBE|nr:disease resistance protein At4g27190-like [Prosopis alba]